MPWRETPDPEVFEELLEGVQSRQQTRFDGTDPRPSEFCSECACPPWQPHERTCSRRDTQVDAWARFYERA